MKEASRTAGHGADGFIQNVEMSVICRSYEDFDMYFAGFLRWMYGMHKYGYWLLQKTILFNFVRQHIPMTYKANIAGRA